MDDFDVEGSEPRTKLRRVQAEEPHKFSLTAKLHPNLKYVSLFMLFSYACFNGMQPLLTSFVYQGRITIAQLAQFNMAHSAAGALATFAVVLRAERVGRKPVLMEAALSAGVVMGCMGLRWDYYPLLVGLILLGGIARIPRTVGRIVLNDLSVLENQRQSKVYTELASQIGLALGPLAAGAAAKQFDFRTAMFIQSGLALAAYLCARFVLPETALQLRPQMPSMLQTLGSLRAALATEGVTWLLASTSISTALSSALLLQAVPSLALVHCPSLLRPLPMGVLLAVMHTSVVALLCLISTLRLSPEGVIFLSGLGTVVVTIFLASATSMWALSAGAVAAGCLHFVGQHAVHERLHHCTLPTHLLNPTVCASTLLNDLCRVVGIAAVFYLAPMFGHPFTFHLLAFLLMVQLLIIARTAGIYEHKDDDADRSGPGGGLGRVWRWRGAISLWILTTWMLAEAATNLASTFHHQDIKSSQAVVLGQVELQQVHLGTNPVSGGMNPGAPWVQRSFASFYQDDSKEGDMRAFRLARSNCSWTEPSAPSQYTCAGLWANTQDFSKDFMDFHAVWNLGNSFEVANPCAKTGGVKYHVRNCVVNYTTGDQNEGVWVIQRMGPFKSRGGGQFTQVGSNNFGNTRQLFADGYIWSSGAVFGVLGEDEMQYQAPDTFKIINLDVQWGLEDEKRVSEAHLGFPPMHNRHSSLMAPPGVGAPVGWGKGEAPGGEAVFPWLKNGDGLCRNLNDTSDCSIESMRPEYAIKLGGRDGLIHMGNWEDMRPRNSPPLTFHTETAIRLQKGPTQHRVSRVFSLLGYPGSLSSPPSSASMPLTPEDSIPASPSSRSSAQEPLLSASAFSDSTSLFSSSANTPHSPHTMGFYLPEGESCMWGQFMPASGGELLVAYLHARMSRLDTVWIFAATADQLGLNKYPLLIDSVDPAAVYQPFGYGMDNEEVKHLVMANLANSSKMLIEDVRPLCTGGGHAHLVGKVDYDRTSVLRCMKFKFKRGQVFTQISFFRGTSEDNSASVQTPYKAQSNVVYLMRWDEEAEKERSWKWMASSMMIPMRDAFCPDCIDALSFVQVFCRRSVKHMQYCVRTFGRIGMNVVASRLEYHFGVKLLGNMIE